MSDTPKRISDWTIADLQRELKAMGAVLTHCSQNMNRKHFPQEYKEWGVHLMSDPEIPVLDPEWKLVTGSGKTIEIAIARAFQKWNAVPDFGETERRRQAMLDASRPKPKITSADELLAKLGLKK